MSSSRAIDWSASGIPGGIPNRTRVCATINASDYGNGTVNAATAIQNALNACGSGVTQESGAGVVALSSGTFLLNSALSIPSWVTLRGAGPLTSSGTVLDCHMSGGRCAGMGQSFVTPPTASQSTHIDGGATQGSASLTVRSATGISVGTYLMITETNDSNYVTITTPNGTCGYCDSSMWNGTVVEGETLTNGTRVRGQIVEVTSVSGTTIGITPALVSNYPNSALATRFTAGTKWAGLEAVQLYSNNTLSAATGGMITMDLVAYCWVKGVMTNYTERDHVAVAYAYRGEIRDSYFSQTFVHTSGSTYEGSIFIAGKTSGFLVENNIIERSHSSVLLDWGPTGNVFAYNYTWGAYDTNYLTANDIEMAMGHGAHPQYNLLEGNVSVNFEPDYFWGTSSYMTAFRNWAMGTTPLYPFTDGTYNATATRKTINFSAPSWPTNNIRAFDIAYTATNTNLIGNVAGSSLITQSKYTSGPSECPACIVSPASRSYNGIFYGFVFDYNGPGSPGSGGGPMPIGSAYNTAFLHGNYDIASNNIFWDVHGTGSHTLPASFYRASKPSWWGSVIPWPAIGPDVTTGDGPGTHAYLTASNPAQACYNATAKDAYGLLQFDPVACYGEQFGSAPAVIQGGIVLQGGVVIQ